MEQSTLDRTMASRIKERLDELNMSQAELGRQMNLGVDAISRRMRGKIPFKACELPLAAKALRMTMAELLEEGEPDGVVRAGEVAGRVSRRAD